MDGEQALVVFDEELRYLAGESVSLAADLFIQAVCEKGVELQARDAAFGEQCSVLLDEGEEVLGSTVAGEDDGFSEEGSDLAWYLSVTSLPSAPWA